MVNALWNFWLNCECNKVGQWRLMLSTCPFCPYSPILDTHTDNDIPTNSAPHSFRNEPWLGYRFVKALIYVNVRMMSDRFRLLPKRPNFHVLVHSGNPALDEIMEYYVQHPSKHIGSLIRLRMVSVLNRTVSCGNRVTKELNGQVEYTYHASRQVKQPESKLAKEYVGFWHDV